MNGKFSINSKAYNFGQVLHPFTVNIITNLRNFVLQALLLVITPWVCQIHQDLTSREIQYIEIRHTYPGDTHVKNFP